MSLRRWPLVVGVMVLTACITESRGLLFFALDAVPPDSTALLSIPISGRVIRTPPRAELNIVVTVTGGVAQVDATANDVGSFRLNVRLQRLQRNVLVLTADDGTGSLSENLEFVVTHVEETPAFIEPRSQR